MSVLYTVNRVDGRGIVRSAFPVEPVPGDVITLASPEQDLEGRFVILRREYLGGVGGTVELIVDEAPAAERTTSDDAIEHHRDVTRSVRDA